MIRILHGDCLDRLREMETSSADAFVTDPPYGLGTKEPTIPEIVAYLTGAPLDMGGDWQIPSVETWREAFRVLKPGAHVLAFGGTRTFDIISLGLRAAGFEYRDTLSWIHGQGFPKSARVNADPRFCQCVAVGRSDANRAHALAPDDRSDTAAGARDDAPLHGNFPEVAALRDFGGDSGGASRFFPQFEWGPLDEAAFLYCAKPSTDERERGTEWLPKRTAAELVDRKPGSAALSSPRTGAGRTSRGRANVHPTVKPVALMRWLCRLVTPKGGLVLDPFAGSGTTGVACALEGFRFIGIEREAEYVEVARARIAEAQGPLFARTGA